MVLFASESDRMDYERGYDYDSELLAVLRQEAFDPQEFVATCDDHGTCFDVRYEGCEDCFEAPVEAPVEAYDPEDEPPF